MNWVVILLCHRSSPIRRIIYVNEEVYDATSANVSAARHRARSWRRSGADRRWPIVGTGSREGRGSRQEIDDASHIVGQTGFGGHLGFSDGDTHGAPRGVLR